MTSPQTRPPAIERFYAQLDPQISEELTPEQKAGVEKAVLAITLGARHKVDIRRSFPFFGKRFYLVFLLGRESAASPGVDVVANLAHFFAADCRAVCHQLYIADAVYDQICIGYRYFPQFPRWYLGLVVKPERPLALTDC